MENNITKAKKFSESDKKIKKKAKCSRIFQLFLETFVSLLPLLFVFLFLFLVNIGLKPGVWILLDGDLVWCSFTSLIMVFFEIFFTGNKQKYANFAMIVNVLYALAIAAVYIVIKFVNNINAVTELVPLNEGNAYKLIIGISAVTFIINIVNILIFWREN